MVEFTSLANTTISPDGLTATNTAAGLGTARGHTVAAGKVYVEAKVNGTWNGGFGFANTTEASYTCGSVNSFGITQDGTVWNNTYSYLTNFSSALANNDILRFAFDVPNALWWVQRNVEGWNPFYATPDPATGVSGFAPSSGGGPWFLYFANDVAAGGVTINVGGSAYVYTPPAGYGKYAPSAGGVLMPRAFPQLLR